MLRHQQAHTTAFARKHIVQDATEIIEEMIAHKKNKNMPLNGKQKNSQA